MTENSKDRRAQILALGHAIGAFADKEYETALEHLDNACFGNTDARYYQTCRFKYLVYRKLDRMKEAESVLCELSALAHHDPEKQYENVFFARDICNEFDDPDLASKLIHDFAPDDAYYQEELRGVNYLINRLRSGSSWEEDMAFIAGAHALTVTVDSVINRMTEAFASREQALRLISELESKAKRVSADESRIWTEHIENITERLAKLP